MAKPTFKHFYVWPSSYWLASCEYVHTLSEGAMPTQELIRFSWMRRRDMAMLCNSGEGSLYTRLGTASLDADDSQLCSAAVP